VGKVVFFSSPSNWDDYLEKNCGTMARGRDVGNPALSATSFLL